MLEMQQDMVALRPAATALADLDLHGAGDDIARTEVLGVWCVALHESLAFAIGQIAAFAARPLGDQTAGTKDAGRMKLDELHVLQWQSGAQRHRVAVAGADMRLGRRQVGAAATPGRQYHDMCAKQMEGAVLQAPGDDPAAGAVLHDEIEREILDKELGIVLEALLVEGVQ